MRYEQEVRDILSDGEEWHGGDIYEAIARLIPTAPYVRNYLSFSAGMDFDENPRLWLICRRDAGRWRAAIQGVLLKGTRQGWVENTRRGYWKKLDKLCGAW